jgi:hypothetical protein
VWVFVLLGGIIGAIALVLYFANAVGGGEKDYWYGDPSRNICNIQVMGHLADSRITEGNV